MAPATRRLPAPMVVWMAGETADSWRSGVARGDCDDPRFPQLAPTSTGERSGSRTRSNTAECGERDRTTTTNRVRSLPHVAIYRESLFN